MGIVYSPMNNCTTEIYNWSQSLFPLHRHIEGNYFVYSAYWLKRNFYAVYHFKRIVERAGFEPAFESVELNHILP